MTTADTLLLAGCFALVVWSCWRWAAIARLPGTLDVLVACGVLVFGTLVGLTLLVGGAFQALSTGPILLATLATGVLAGATTASPARRARIAGARQDLLRGLGELGPALRSPLVLVLAATAVVAVGYRVLIAIAFPVLDWDALGYHLPTVDYWLQEGRIVTGPFSYWGQIHPGGAETVIGWTAALTGTVRAAAAVQIVAALLGALTTAALCRAVGCSVRSALVGALLFLLAPMVLVQLSTAEVDIVAAALLLATWHLLLLALRAGRPQLSRRRRKALDERVGMGALPDGPQGRPQGDGAPAGVRAPTADEPDRRIVLPALLVAGIGAGVAVGVKTTNVASVGVLWLLLVATLVWRHLSAGGSRKDRARPPWLQVACFTLPALALGGYWYVRNTVRWGNPLYPLPLAFLPGDPAVVELVSVDRRQVGTTNEYWALLVSWASDLDWRVYFYGSFTGGLGAQWLLVLAPAVLAALWLLARSRHRVYAYGLLAPGLLLLAIYPGSYHTRYTLYLLGFGGLAIAVVLDRLPRWPRHAVMAVLTAATVFSASAATWQALDLSGAYDEGFTPRDVLATMRMSEKDRDLVGLRAAFEEAYEVEPGVTIVVPPEFGDYGEPWVLPHSLWGDDLEREVIKADDPIETVDEALAALDEHDADYVVVSKQSDLEADLVENPDAFHPAFTVGWLAVAWAPGPPPGDG